MLRPYEGIFIPGGVLMDQATTKKPIIANEVKQSPAGHLETASSLAKGAVPRVLGINSLQ